MKTIDVSEKLKNIAPELSARQHAEILAMIVLEQAQSRAYGRLVEHEKIINHAMQVTGLPRNIVEDNFK